MNKLLTKIAGVALGLTMAVGVGVNFGVGSSKDAVPVMAASTSASVTLTSKNNITASDAFPFNVTYSGTWTWKSPQCRTEDTSATVTFSGNSSVGEITKIEIGCSSSGYAPTGSANNSYTTSVSSSTVSVSGSGSTSVVWTPGAAARLKTFKVTYNTASSNPSVAITSSPTYLVDGGASGSLTATITNDNSYTVTWSANPSDGVTFNPATSASGSSVSVSFDGVTTGTTPIELIATIDDGNSTSSSKNVYALAHAGTSTDPFTATDAMVFSHTNYAAQSGGNWYVEGYVVGTYNTDRGYYIDEDSTATTSPYKFEVYNSSGVTNSTGKEIIVGTSYIVAHGSMTYYAGGSQCEITSAIITSVDNGSIPNVVINERDQSIFMNDELTFTATTENPDDATVTWSSSDADVATIGASTGVVTTVGEGTTTITATITVDGKDYTNSVTLEVTTPVLNIGDEIYFYAEYSSTTYYMAAVGQTSSSTESDRVTFIVESGSTNGTYSFKNGNDYLKCTTSAPYLGNGTDKDSTTSWTVTDSDNGIIVTSVSSTNRSIMWNYNSGSPRFGAYASSSATILRVQIGVPAVPTYVALDKSELTLENGTSEELTYTTDEYVTFKWTSSNPSVATVDNSGLVECIADSGNSIIRVFFDTNKNGVYDSGEPNSTCTVTAVPAQIHFADSNYGGVATRIDADSTGTSLDGKKVIFGCASKTTISGSLSGVIITSHDTSEESFEVSYDSTNHQFTVGNGRVDTGITVYTLHSVSSGVYSISTTISGNTKYLSETAVKKLAYADNAYSWTISVSSGTATIQSSNGYLKYNSGSPRFTTYASGQTDIELYEYASFYEEATEYAELFIKGDTNNTCAETIKNWDDLGDLFTFISTGAQNIFKIATHNAPETYTTADEYTVEHAVARYDDALLKHTELRDNEFMGRVDEGTLDYNSTKFIHGLLSTNESNVSIIIIISLVSVTALGGYFFIKKKKHQ